MTSLDSTKTNVTKPFLKWVGGKTQILESILTKIPKSINTYHEPFLGGGSVLFALLSLQKEGKVTIKKKIFANDSNKGVINLFKAIQQDHNKFLECISSYVSIYDSLTGTIINRSPSTLEEARTSKESYYYWIRQRFNEFELDPTFTSFEYAAMFLFLNKTGFRGMYRVGPKGFNVPYGHYLKTPTIADSQHIQIVSELIQPVTFTCQDFEQTMIGVKKGDFVYLDPPYAPEAPTSFVKYNEDGFNLDTHMRLFECIKNINKKKIKFLMNNAKVDLVIDNFQECNCSEIIARRSIHSKNPASTTTEIIVYN